MSVLNKASKTLFLTLLNKFHLVSKIIRKSSMDEFDFKVENIILKINRIF